MNDHQFQVVAKLLRCCLSVLCIIVGQVYHDHFYSVAWTCVGALVGIRAFFKS